MSNSGVGPAKLQSFEVVYKGQPARSGLDLLRRCCGLGPDVADIPRLLPRGDHFEITDHTVLHAGEAKAAFGVWRGNPVGEAFASPAHDVGEGLSGTQGRVRPERRLRANSY